MHLRKKKVKQFKKQKLDREKGQRVEGPRAFLLLVLYPRLALNLCNPALFSLFLLLFYFYEKEHKLWTKGEKHKDLETRGGGT